MHVLTERAPTQAKLYSDQSCQTEVRKSSSKSKKTQDSASAPSASQASSSYGQILQLFRTIHTDMSFRMSKPSSGGLRIRIVKSSGSRLEASHVAKDAPLPHIAMSSPLPPGRVSTLANFAPVDVNLDKALTRGFPRPHLGKCLGGGSQSLIAKCVSILALLSVLC